MSDVDFFLEIKFPSGDLFKGLLYKKDLYGTSSGKAGAPVTTF